MPDGWHPAGAPLIGVLSDAFGPRVGVSAGGAVCAVAAVVAAVVVARRPAGSVAVGGPDPAGARSEERVRSGGGPGRAGLVSRLRR